MEIDELNVKKILEQIIVLSDGAYKNTYYFEDLARSDLREIKGKVQTIIDIINWRE